MAKLRHLFWLVRLALNSAHQDPSTMYQVLRLILHGTDHLPVSLSPKILLLTLANTWGITAKVRLSEFTAIELAKLTYELRKFLTDAGIAIPRADVMPSRVEASALATRDTLAKIYELAARLSFSQRKLEAFTRRQLKGRRTIKTERDARTVLYGLQGVLRHRKEAN